MPIPTQAVWAVGEKTGGAARRHSLLYCRRPSEAYQQPQREYLPLPVRIVHRFLLDRAIIRFSGPPLHLGRSRCTLQANRPDR